MTTTATYHTPHELALLGFEALVQKLGPDGALRFINMYERGSGDYTKERRRILRAVTLEDMKEALVERGPG